VVIVESRSIERPGAPCQPHTAIGADISSEHISPNSFDNLAQLRAALAELGSLLDRDDIAMMSTKKPMPNMTPYSIAFVTPRTMS
jgi:hypothetical protein